MLMVRRWFVFAVGACGVAGSLLSIAASYVPFLPAALIGQVFRSTFVACFVASWGAVYCREGSRSATLYVAGGFAFALICDLLLLLMVPPIPSIAFAILPAISSLLLVEIDEEKRSFRLSGEQTKRAVPNGEASDSNLTLACGENCEKDRAWGKVARYVGVSPATVFGLMLVMVGFGYTQCQASLEASGGGLSFDGPVFIQLIRGVVAVALFAMALAMPKKMSVVFRAGLLVFIAGFFVMPFPYATGRVWIAGAVVIGGYTAVDVFIWVITAQAACIRSTDPLRTVCIMRLFINCVCTTIGRVLGFVVSIVLPEIMPDDTFIGPAISILGYLMTAAVVLLLSGREMWELFRANPPQQDAHDKQGVDIQSERIDRLSVAFAVTQREKEVFQYLAVGRTKPWIARHLGISESTVSTHVRSLYAKLGISDRQELLDLVVYQPSSDSEERVG